MRILSFLPVTAFPFPYDIVNIVYYCECNILFGIVFSLKKKILQIEIKAHKKYSFFSVV